MAKYRRYYYWKWTNYYWDKRQQKKIWKKHEKTTANIMENERMPFDIKASAIKRHENKTRRKQYGSFYWWYVRLLKLNNSFTIPIDINNLKDNNLLLQKRIKDRDAKKDLDS